MTDLRVTLRALCDDFDLDESFADEPPTQLATLHQVLKAYFQRRSKNSEGVEVTKFPSSSQIVFNLHAGCYRGLTWYDKDDDVVWLLGAGWHEHDSIHDAYRLLKNLDAADRLVPSADDYKRLYMWRENTGVTNLSELFNEASERGSELVASAE